MKFRHFTLNNIKGFSEKQLNSHYKLYEGYINKINEIFELEQNDKLYTNPNATYSQIRCLKSGESYALNGAKLHELYFENLNFENNILFGKIASLIVRDFLSYERFIKQFKSIGLAMRGWVVLAIDPKDNRLHLYGSDSHDIGPIWSATPLLGMSMSMLI